MSPSLLTGYSRGVKTGRLVCETTNWLLADALVPWTTPVLAVEVLHLGYRRISWAEYRVTGVQWRQELKPQAQARGKKREQPDGLEFLRTTTRRRATRIRRVRGPTGAVPAVEAGLESPGEPMLEIEDVFEDEVAPVHVDAATVADLFGDAQATEEVALFFDSSDGGDGDAPQASKGEAPCNPPAQGDAGCGDGGGDGIDAASRNARKVRWGPWCAPRGSTHSGLDLKSAGVLGIPLETQHSSMIRNTVHLSSVEQRAWLRNRLGRFVPSTPQHRRSPERLVQKANQGRTKLKSGRMPCEDETVVGLLGERHASNLT